MKWTFALMLALVLAACLSLAAAEGAAAPKLIEAQPGEPAAMQIRSLESDHVVGILGVESEPLPCAWGDFNGTISQQLKGITFSPAYWSDGSWVRLFDSYDLVIRVYVTDETDDALIRSVIVNTPSKDGALDVQTVTAIAYAAAAHVGTYGTYTVRIVLSEDHSEDWFTTAPIQIWTENGYTLTYGQTDGLGLPCGEVQFVGETAVTGGYLPLENDYVYLPEGKTPAALMEALTEQSNSGTLASMLSKPVWPETYETEEDGRVYLMEWDDCLAVIFTDETGENLRVVSLMSMSGDTTSMCVHLYPLFVAVSGGPVEDMMLISAFIGGNGTWDDMCGLAPYCVMNGVQLQCSLTDMGNGTELPMADICGAEPSEATASFEEESFVEEASSVSEQIFAETAQPDETQSEPPESTGVDYSFHGASWGMTKAEVRALEEDEPYQEPASATGHSALVYRLGTPDAFQIIQYNFLPSGALYNITIMAPDASGSFYAEQRESLTAQYGEPLTEAGADLHSDDDPVAVMMAALMQNSGDSDFLGWRADDETVIIMSMEPMNKVCYVEIRRYTDYFRFQ